jgi:methyl-accepting chemotaxis protein
MFKNTKIGAMLYLLIGVLLILLITIGVLGLRGLGKTSDNLKTIYDDRLVPIVLLSKINSLRQDSIQQLLQAQFHDPKLQVSKLHEDDHPVSKHLDEVTANREKSDDLWEQYMKTYLTPEEEKLAKNYIESRDKYRSEGLNPAISLLKEKKFDEASLHSFYQLIPLYKKAEQDIDALVQIQLDVAKNEKDKADANGVYTRNLTITSIIGGILLTLGISFWIIRSVTRRLTVSVSSLAASATEIAATVTQHERTMLQQTASVSETTATTEELRVSAQTSSDQAENAAVVVRKALQLAQEGSFSSERASVGINDLQEKVRAVAEQILQLSEQAGQIGVIAKVVGDLASETNMLALNAAVEAARAGENGKGFAVVASEVRKLADQSKKSAERANALVADIQKATNSAVMVAEEGRKTAKEVFEISMKNGETFHALAEYAGMIDQNTQQIVLNSRQQAGALSQIGDAMKHLNAGSSEMAAGSTQTKFGLQSLTEVATLLKAMI